MGDEIFFKSVDQLDDLLKDFLAFRPFHQKPFGAEHLRNFRKDRATA